MEGACEVLPPLPGRDVAMDLSVRENKIPWKRKEESDEEDRKPSSSTHDVSNGSPDDGSNRSEESGPHKPQDLRLRRILNEGRKDKKERLEEMVNHIKRVSAEQQRPVMAASWGRTNRTERECSDETSDEEGSWRPEDIFFLRSTPPTQDDVPSPQDLRVKRPRSNSPSPPSHPPNAPTAALVQRFLQMALPWPSYDPQSPYLPWMAYNYYAQLTRQQYGERRRGGEEEEEEAAETPSPPLPAPPHPSTARKRAPRALTGKHVKQGTGASPSTLRTLRQAIEQRQRIRPSAPTPSSGRAKTSRRKAASSTATSASASRLHLTPSAPIVP